MGMLCIAFEQHKIGTKEFELKVDEGHSLYETNKYGQRLVDFPSSKKS